MAPHKASKTTKASGPRKVDQKQSKVRSLNLYLPSVLLIRLNQAAAHLEPINSGEEFSFEDIDSAIPETDDPQVLESQGVDHDSCHPSVDTSALDIAHFFVAVGDPEAEDDAEVLNVCKLCM